MTPEQEILGDVLEQVHASVLALDETLTVLLPLPATLAEYRAQSPLQRIAGTALLKQVEQTEDGLARAFRTVLRMLGQNLKGLYAFDIANHMIELDVLDEPEAWVQVVKLRNELVHEYPLPAELRLERLIRAHAAVSLLRDAAARLVVAVRTRRLLPDE